MRSVPLVDPDFPPPQSGLMGLIGLVTKRVLIFTFILWQVFFLAFRNPVDLWQEDVEKWAKRQSWWDETKPEWKRCETEYFDPVTHLTRGYARFFGIEQGWSMFTPNLARRGKYLDARIEFTDGTELEIPSENHFHHYENQINRGEAYRPRPFFRLGGWRQRKLEDSLIEAEPDKVGESDDFALYSAFVRWTVERWHKRWPNDKRQPFRIVLLRRIVYFPKITEDATNPFNFTIPDFTDPNNFKKPDTESMGFFNPDGSLRK